MFTCFAVLALLLIVGQFARPRHHRHHRHHIFWKRLLFGRPRRHGGRRPWRRGW